MRETMAHRGPDGAVTWVSADRRVGLGHRKEVLRTVGTGCVRQAWCPAEFRAVVERLHRRNSAARTLPAGAVVSPLLRQHAN
jgi:hypothetical protein